MESLLSLSISTFNYTHPLNSSFKGNPSYPSQSPLGHSIPPQPASEAKTQPSNPIQEMRIFGGSHFCQIWAHRLLGSLAHLIRLVFLDPNPSPNPIYQASSSQLCTFLVIRKNPSPSFHSSPLEVNFHLWGSLQVIGVQAGVSFFNISKKTPKGLSLQGR